MSNTTRARVDSVSRVMISLLTALLMDYSLYYREYQGVNNSAVIRSTTPDVKVIDTTKPVNLSGSEYVLFEGQLWPIEME